MDEVENTRDFETIKIGDKALYEQITAIDEQLEHCMTYIKPLVPLPIFGLLTHLQVMIMDLDQAIQAKD